MALDINEQINSEPSKTEFENSDFCIAGKINLDQIKFKNCHFFFQEDSQFIASKSSFEGCVFEGIDIESGEYHGNRGEIQINESKLFKDIRLEKKFRDIRIIRSDIIDLIDISWCETLIYQANEITDFFIKGSCKTVNISNTYFTFKDRKDSIWSKTIDKSAHCKETIFHKVEVNPFFLATKCQDKTSLDLTSAKLIDDWSRLRKNYSGVSLFIVFLLSFFYFLPLMTHSFFLLLAHKVDPLTQSLDQIPLWQSLLFGGKTGIAAFGYSILTIILLSYNSLRIWMTISISKLREEEKFLGDSNFHLVSIHPEKFQTELKVDKLLKWMFWVSAIYAGFKIWDTLTIAVPSFG